jgi:spore coat polysaccharide biosynthesis protein SpsF
MNEQEAFWRGSFGDDYVDRHGNAEVEPRVIFWDRVFDWGSVDAPSSVIEFGANAGLNLRAIRLLFRQVELPLGENDLFGVEINEKAAAELGEHGFPHRVGSMLGFDPGGRRWDLAFTMGVLIHVAPQDLPRAYEALDAASDRYVLMAEYYSSTPREIEYRGHRGRLWARDFCSGFMEQFSGQYQLRDYGFAYHGDPECPLDDVTWMLMERSL